MVKKPKREKLLKQEESDEEHPWIHLKTKKIGVSIKNKWHTGLLKIFFLKKINRLTIMAITKIEKMMMIYQINNNSDTILK